MADAAEKPREELPASERIFGPLAGALLALVAWIARTLPEPWLRALSRAAAWIVFGAARYRRRVIDQNLARALPDRTEAERRAIARAAGEHLILSLAEFLRLPRYARDGFDRVARLEGMEHYFAAKAKGKGSLCLTGHLGSFELAAAAFAARYPGEKISLVVKSFPPGVEGVVSRIRTSSGLALIPASGGMPAILSALANNQCVVFVLDQNATRRLGVFVDFFGHPASTMSALALIAVRSGAPVFGASSWREPDGTHVVRAHPEIPMQKQGSFKQTVRHMTQLYTRFIEEQIRLHPEQWLWTHRRWRTQPKGED